MKYTFGLGFVGLGVLILLSAMGLLHTSVESRISIFYPVLLVAGGVETFYRSLRKGKTEILVPLILVVVGVFVLLQNLHWLGFGSIDPWSLVFAIFLIYIGIQIFMSGVRRSLHFPFLRVRKNRKWWNAIDFTMEESENGAWTVSGAPIPPKRPMSKIPKVGEVRYGDGPWTLEPMFIQNAAGTIRINLGTAVIPEGETPIVIRGGLGEVRIDVPHDVAVSVEAQVTAGEVRLFNQRHGGVSLNTFRHTDPGYADAPRRVLIQVDLKFGEIRITR